MNKILTKAVKYLIDNGFAYSQADIYKKSGIRKQLFSDIINERKPLTVHYVRLINEAYPQISASFLLGESDKIECEDSSETIADSDISDSISDRIKQVLNTKSTNANKLSKGDSAMQMRLSRQLNGANVTAQTISYIIEEYPDVSAEWLLTGEGNMIKNGIDINGSVERTGHPKSVEKINDLVSVSLYDVEAAANLKSLFTNKEQNILGQITIPNIPNCDGAVYVRGDSMYPLLKSGDIILYKEIYDPQNIIYGEMYLLSLDIEGDEYLTVKYVNTSEKGEEWCKLVSYNPHHSPKDIKMECINALAIVKVNIRMNTIK